VAENSLDLDLSGGVIPRLDAVTVPELRTMILALDYELRTDGIGGTSHGGVWIVGNFQNRQRLLRDLVVGSGQIGVFVEYNPLAKRNCFTTC
jgi:acetyl esterase